MNKNTFRILIVLAIISFLIFKLSNLKINFSEIKKETSIDLPNEYAEIFNNSKRTEIKHLNTSIPNDKSYFPISNIRLNSEYITIFKFESKLPINKILKIKKEQTERTSSVWYRVIPDYDLTINYVQNTLSKNIDIVEIISDKKIDTLLVNGKIFLCSGNLKNLSLQFSKNKRIKDIFVEKKLFKSPEFSIALLKKENSLFIMFFTPEKISKKEFYELINIENY